jgi:Flp pilus assembly protein TadD
LKCPVCYADCEDRHRFCPECGAKLEAEEPSTLDEMIHDFQTRLSKEPKDADARYNLALAQIRLRRFEQAAEQLAQVAELEPQAAEVFEKLAYCLARSGEREAALVAARRALELDPERETARAIIERLRG